MKVEGSLKKTRFKKFDERRKAALDFFVTFFGDEKKLRKNFNLQKELILPL